MMSDVSQFAKIKINELPWDPLGIILNYLPRNEVYPILKGVNRLFHKLSQKRKVGLVFSKQEVTQKLFFSITDKSKATLTSLTIKCRSFNNISPTVIEQHLVTFVKL